MIHPAPDTITGMATAKSRTATKAVISGKLRLAQIQGRSITAHRYSTNDRGKPKGGGPRFAYGVTEN